MVYLIHQVKETLKNQKGRCTMTNKLTNRKALAIAMNVLQDLQQEAIENGAESYEFKFENQCFSIEDVLNKLNSMVATLDNKATSTKRKPTKTQVENASFRDNILAFLRENPNLIVTCTDITKRVPELEGQTNQKVSALMQPLVKAKAVVKLTEKGKTYFQLAKSDVELEDNGDEG